jgi:hypothetical protein
MRVLIQWAKATPDGWTEHEISRVQDWRSLPSKPLPASPDEPVDNNPGWINAMCIQGVVFTKADRYSIQGMPGGGLQVWMWYDSPVDYPPGERAGAVWTFLDPAPDVTLPITAEWALEHPDIPTGQIGDLWYRINTRQSCQWYAEAGSIVAANMDEAEVLYLPWSQFPVPAANTQRFGKWLTYEQFDEHVNNILPLPGWREWVV